MNDRRHLDRMAQQLSNSGRLEGPVVVVGHSAGAASGAWMTPALVRSGVHIVGLVFVDGNDSPNRLIERSWKDLESVPIKAVMAPPSRCNRYGRLTRYLEELRPGSVEVVPGAGHGDFEMTDSSVYRRLCQDRSGPAAWAAVQRAVLAAIAGLIEDSSG